MVCSAQARLIRKDAPQAEAVKNFLECPRSEAMKLLQDAWIESESFNELRLMPGLVCEGEWSNNPQETREFLLNLLDALPENKWWSLGAFVRDLKQKYADFQRHAGDYDSWFIKRWNVGDLNILTAPLFDNPQRLASQVAGELAWSPNGSTIAYFGLRRSDTLFTIGLAYPDERPSRDLFPGETARTDGFSSQKAVYEWIDDGRWWVYTSCGIDCMQRMDIGVITGLSTSKGDPIQRNWELWSVHTDSPMNITSEYPDLAGQLNWSPDESQIAYIDEDGYVWIINVDNGNLFPLDIGVYGTATETDWSYDRQYLAVHVDQNLKIFSFNCP